MVFLTFYGGREGIGGRQGVVWPSSRSLFELEETRMKTLRAFLMNLGDWPQLVQEITVSGARGSYSSYVIPCLIVFVPFCGGNGFNFNIV